MPVLEPRVLRSEQREQLEVKVVISVTAKMGELARMRGGAQNKQLKMVQMSLLRRVAQRAEKEGLQIKLWYSKVGIMLEINPFVLVVLV